MEKIFEDSRKSVYDGGFSDRVIKQIVENTPKPSRAIYRTPTLIATFAVSLMIVVLTFAVGLDKMNDEYDKLADKMAYHEYPVESCIEIDNGIE